MQAKKVEYCSTLKEAKITNTVHPFYKTNILDFLANMGNFHMV
jgi:hypothetical protein